MTDRNTFYYTDHETFYSSFAENAWYNSDTQEVVFETPSGTVLYYTGMPPALWDQFKDASSQGRFFQTHIKGVLEYHENDFLFFLKPADLLDPSLPVESPAESDIKVTKPSSGKEYTVVANFATFEDAQVAFSYAETSATSVSLSVYASDDDE